MVVALAFLKDCIRVGMLSWSAHSAAARHFIFTGKARRSQLAYRLKRLSERYPTQPGIHLTPSPLPTFAPFR